MIIVLARGFQNICLDVPDQHQQLVGERIMRFREAGNLSGFHVMALQMELARDYNVKTVPSRTFNVSEDHP